MWKRDGYYTQTFRSLHVINKIKLLLVKTFLSSYHQMYCNNIVEACLLAMLLPEQQLLFPSVGYEGAEWDRWGAGGPGKTREARDTCKHEHTLLHDSILRE